MKLDHLNLRRRRMVAASLGVSFVGLGRSGPAPAAPRPVWSGRSGAGVPRVVELYTSEGCNSCPPAEAWLSELRSGDTLVVAAFHVDYWDHLGWKDPYARAAYAQRQRLRQVSSGARFVYTPQVVVDGRDWRGWPQAPLPPARASRAVIDTSTDADGSQSLRIAGRQDAPPSLVGWWAWLEHGLQSQVSAGENSGRRLRHDHVVRVYGEIAPASTSQARTLSLPPAPGPTHTLVVVLNGEDSPLPVAALAVASA